MSECEHCEDLGVAENSDGCAIEACPHCKTGRDAFIDEGAFWLSQSRWAAEKGDCESYPGHPEDPSDEWFSGVASALQDAHLDGIELSLIDLARKYARDARLWRDAYEWAKVPVGTPVIYRGQRTATASEIFIRGSRAVIRLDGLSSYYDVRSVELLREVSR